MSIFFDDNLSSPPGQACADCHSPETGFSNPNQNLPVSQGVHKDRFGNRNDLTAAYAGFAPELHNDEEEEEYIESEPEWDGEEEYEEEEEDEMEELTAEEMAAELYGDTSEE